MHIFKAPRWQTIAPGRCALAHLFGKSIQPTHLHLHPPLHRRSIAPLQPDFGEFQGVLDEARAKRAEVRPDLLKIVWAFSGPSLTFPTTTCG